MMKKLFALLAVAVFLFAACGNQTKTTPEKETAQETEQTCDQETEQVADIVPPVDEEVNPEDVPAEDAPVEGEAEVQA